MCEVVNMHTVERAILGEKRLQASVSSELRKIPAESIQESQELFFIYLFIYLIF